MWQRIRSLWNQQYATGAMLDYLQYPLPDIVQDYRKAAYLVLDLETTGLDPEQHEVISIGMVEIKNWRIQLGSTEHQLIKASQSVAQSAIYHGIVDNELENAAPLDSIMLLLLERLQGRILVVHSASVDLAFLNVACKQLYQSSLLVHTVDTMALGMRRYRLEQRHIPEDGLRLHALRELYRLPGSHAHHALSDAIATAELFMAMATYMAGKKAMAVKRLLI